MASAHQKKQRSPTQSTWLLGKWGKACDGCGASDALKVMEAERVVAGQLDLGEEMSRGKHWRIGVLTVRDEEEDTCVSHMRRRIHV